MKVILTADHKKLGRKGDLVEVSEGFARNALLPQNLAIAASEKAQKERSKELKAAEAEKSAAASENRAMQQKLDGKELTISAKATDGKLYGRVGAHEVAEALTKEYNVSVRAAMVTLPHPIKEVGTTPVQISFDAKTSATVRVTVTADGS